jgi:putative oxidoreductase
VIQPTAPAATILIRFMIGAVFVAEGVQKFLYPGEVGAGRFGRSGIPSAEIIAPLVGAVETVCGALVLMGSTPGLQSSPCSPS